MDGWLFIYAWVNFAFPGFSSLRAIVQWSLYLPNGCSSLNGLLMVLCKVVRFLNILLIIERNKEEVLFGTYSIKNTNNTLNWHATTILEYIHSRNYSSCAVDSSRRSLSHYRKNPKKMKNILMSNVHDLKFYKKTCLEEVYRESSLSRLVDLHRKIKPTMVV